MSICEDTIELDVLLEKIEALRDNIGLFFIRGYLDTPSVIQQLALIRRVKEGFEELQGTLVEQLTTTLICKTIEAYNKTQLSTELDQLAADYLQSFEEFETAIDAVAGDEFSEIEAGVDNVLNQYDAIIEERRQLIKDKAFELLSVLEYLGIPREDLELALEEVEYEDDPKAYVLAVFDNLLDKADTSF